MSKKTYHVPSFCGDKPPVFISSFHGGRSPQWKAIRHLGSIIWWNYMELYILTSLMCVMCHMCHGQKLDSVRFTHKLSDDSRMIINPFPSLMNGIDEWCNTNDVPSGKLTSLWKITIFNGKIHYKWPCSIATLNYQRVNDVRIPPYSA